MEFPCQGNADGTLTFGPVNRAKLKQLLREHPGIRLNLTVELPESGRLRRYFEGALVPLICFYQEGLDHHSSDDRAKVRDWLKAEFNGEMVIIDGKAHVVPKSTRGRPVLYDFVQRVSDWLIENYQPPAEAIDTKHYKHWRSAIYPQGGPDNFIDYLLELRILK